MSEKKSQKKQALIDATEQQLSRSGISLGSFFSKLPNWVLVPTTVVLFGLLLVDFTIADPLPFIDEAALLWALVTGMKVIGSRRRLERGEGDLPELERGESPAPGQPLLEASRGS